MTAALLRGQSPASEAAQSREQEAARDDTLPVALLPTETSLLHGGERDHVPVCVCVGCWGGGSAWRAELDPSEHTGSCPLPPTAPSMRNTATSPGLSPLPPDSLPSSSTPARAKRNTTWARAVLPSLVKQNQFHLLSWEALSCCWLLHQTMALPLTPSQLLFSSGAGTLHVCCFVTAWWMLSDDCIPRRKYWN